MNIRITSLMIFLALASMGLDTSAQAASYVGQTDSPQMQEGQLLAQNNPPVTYVTEVSSNEIVMQITDGEFKFHGYLKRTSGNMFVGEDEQVRVMYDRSTGQVVVINVKTGTEFYNYVFSEADEGAL